LWGERVVAWLAAAGHTPASRGDGRYLGEPILVSANDADLELFNGDTGVVVASAAGSVAAFRRGSRIRTVALARLPAVRSVHAMTVHRAQGSEFSRVTILLPPPDSPLANRQTLYTAITRAGMAVRLIGSAAAVERAVAHPAARATGLGARLRIRE
jgi:exodeoxyribonuclease V alpha subunit